MKGETQYLVFGGTVVSINDGDTHYVSPYRVAELYGLNPYAPNVVLVHSRADLMGREIGKYTALYPHSNGRYNLKKETNE